MDEEHQIHSLFDTHMSTTDLTVAPSAVERPRVPESRTGAGVPWSRVAVACAILLAAGLVRWWQERQVNVVIESGQVSPFPLKELPTTLGSWRVPDKREETLDPEVVQVTKCVDYLKRHYVNDQTGVAVEVLVLYGPSTIAHIPEVCYPGSGYQLVNGPNVRLFPVAGGEASFNSLIFAKGEGGAAERQQVFYALRYGGRWTVNLDFKTINRLPGIYKVQLTRRVSDHERAESRNNPCEAFLEAMLPELENRITRSLSAAPSH
jgi:hypothetical protein